jgi:hypothetical protein
MADKLMKSVSKGDTKLFKLRYQPLEEIAEIIESHNRQGYNLVTCFAQHTDTIIVFKKRNEYDV